MAKGGITHDFSSAGPDPSRIVNSILGKFQKAISTPGMTQLQAKELYLRMLATVGKSGAVPSVVLKQLVPAAQGLMRQGGFEQALTMIREQGNMIAGKVVPPMGLNIAGSQNVAAAQQASQAVQGGARGSAASQVALTGGMVGGPWAYRKLKEANAARLAAVQGSLLNPDQGVDMITEAGTAFKKWISAGKLSQTQASDITTYLATTGKSVPKTLKEAYTILARMSPAGLRGGSYATAYNIGQAAKAAAGTVAKVAGVVAGKKGKAAKALLKLLGPL